MIKAWQAKGLDQDPLLVQHIWHWNSAICDQDVDLMQHWKLLHVLYEYRGHPIDVLTVVKANALCLCYLFGSVLYVSVMSVCVHCLPLFCRHWISRAQPVCQAAAIFT